MTIDLEYLGRYTEPQGTSWSSGTWYLYAYRSDALTILISCQDSSAEWVRCEVYDGDSNDVYDDGPPKEAFERLRSLTQPLVAGQLCDEPDIISLTLRDFWLAYWRSLVCRNPRLPTIIGLTLFWGPPLVLLFENLAYSYLYVLGFSVLGIITPPYDWEEGIVAAMFNVAVISFIASSLGLQ